MANQQETLVLSLLADARASQARGETFEAVRLQRQAIGICRDLGAAEPEEAVHRQALASALYSLGSLLTTAGDFAGAVVALDESEELYLGLGEADELDSLPLVADVQVRRALARARLGAGATAVAEADEAVSAYEALPANDSDLARVHAINALVLELCGDQDLAVASADRAIRSWLSHRQSSTEFEIGSDEANLLVWSCAVAASIHASAGRNDLSLFASELALPILARLVPVQPVTSLANEVRHVTQRYARMSDTERSRAAQYYATTLRTLLWRDIPAPTGPTLAQVLAVEDPELATELTRPATECLIATPSQRCPPSLAPSLATRLADVAWPLLPNDAGLRAGLEAHWLFAAASRARVLRHSLNVYGHTWARLLLALCDAYQTQGRLVMAVDLASWADGLAQQLVPHMFFDAGLATLAVRCVERHAQLLVATGSPTAGAERLAVAAELATLTTPTTGA